MNDNDKKLISEYMGWNIVMVGPQKSPYPIYVDNIDSNIHHRFDLNDAGLCVQEMQKRGDWEYFVAFVEETPENRESLITWNQLIAWLFNADNFFSAFVEWRKGNSIFWAGDENNISEIRNIIAKNLAVLVSKDGKSRSSGMWFVRAEGESKK